MSESVFSRLWSALKGNANNVAEAVADSQNMVIIDQELREANTKHQAAKRALAEMEGRLTLMKRQQEERQTQILDYKAKATAALKQGNEALAREIAERIQLLTREGNDAAASVEAQQKAVDGQREAVKKIDGNIKTMTTMAENTKNEIAIQQARKASAVSASGAGSNLESAQSALTRLRERTALEAATLEAAEARADDESGRGLDERIAKANLEPTESVDDILNSLRS